ncbi:Histamine H2 receptor [Trichoplax sp. H2]|nr:Histamine H2 receptor [Trichoplax sp. H2]|eukprot:RDD38472.1 Histamine H2 receptor [Trichoplax sp. H2]
MVTHESAVKLVAVNGSTITSVIFIILVSMIAFCGNLLVFYVVARNQQLYTYTNAFIINIAVCHFIASIIVTAFIPPSLISGQWIFGNSTSGNYSCDAIGFLIVVLFNVAILTLTVISYIRYYSIKYPMTYTRLINKKRFFILITYVWSQSIIMAVLPFFESISSYEYNHAVGFCTIKPLGTFRFIDIIITLILPFLTVFILAIRILCLLYKNPKSQWRHKISPMSDNNDTALPVNSYSPRRRSYHPHNTIDKQVTYTLLVVVFVNWVLWLPLIVVMLLDSSLFGNQKSAELAVYLLAFSSISINPMMYGALNRNFREGVTELITRWTQHCSLYSCVCFTHDEDSNVNWLCYRKRKINIYIQEA